MNALLDVILPVFLVIGFGYVAARVGLFSEDAVEGLMRFAQNFAVPCLLFKSIAGLDIAGQFDAGLFIAFYTGAFAGFAAGYLGARHIFGRPAQDAVAIGFCCLFSNSLLLGLPIMERAYGAESLAGNFTIIALHSPILYGFGIMVMELTRSHGLGLSAPKLTLQVLRAIFSQPLVIGISCGFAVNLSGVPLPEVFTSGLDMMVRAALPTALFGLGGVLNRYHPEGDMKTIAMVCAISLILHPAITFGLGKVLQLDTAQIRSAVVTAAMAPGANAFLFANMYGVAKRVAASSVLLATAGSIITVWVWLSLLP